MLQLTTRTASAARTAPVKAHCGVVPVVRRGLLSGSCRPHRAHGAAMCSPVGRRVEWRAHAASTGGGAGGGAGSGAGGSGGSGGGSSGGSGDGEAHPMRVWTFVYAAFLAVGGAFAFIKKGSTKSLMSAGGSALILALAGRSMVGATAKSSVFVALAVAVLLTVVMAGRFQRTGKVMPAGMMAGSSLAMSIAYLATAF